MLQLQTACSDIPSMTTATKELHETVTALVLDAHNMQQDRRTQQQQQSTATAAVNGTSTLGLRPGSAITSMVRFGFKDVGSYIQRMRDSLCMVNSFFTAIQLERSLELKCDDLP